MATLVKNPTAKTWDYNSREESLGAYDKRTQAIFDKLHAVSNKVNPRGADLTGAMIRFPAGDGYAHYVVVKTKPLQVMHVPYGDAWCVDPCMIRGLRVQDVRTQLRCAQELTKLFGKRK